MFYKVKAAILKRYIYSFCDTVRAEHKQLTPGKYPAVAFYRAAAYTDDLPEHIAAADVDKAPNGKPLISGYYAAGKIEIYGLDLDKLKYLKQTARHETLHYLLDADGLDYKDTDDLFILLAIKYDARPNAELSDELYKTLTP